VFLGKSTKQQKAVSSMKHTINLADEFAKLGINSPAEELLDAAEAEATRTFALKPALLAAFNRMHGMTEKRRAYTRKNVGQPELNHEP
jgi:hypothetical protein